MCVTIRRHIPNKSIDNLSLHVLLIGLIHYLFHIWQHAYVGFEASPRRIDSFSLRTPFEWICIYKLSGRLKTFHWVSSTILLWERSTAILVQALRRTGFKFPRRLTKFNISTNKSPWWHWKLKNTHESQAQWALFDIQLPRIWLIPSPESCPMLRLYFGLRMSERSLSFYEK